MRILDRLCVSGQARLVLLVKTFSTMLCVKPVKWCPSLKENVEHRASMLLPEIMLQGPVSPKGGQGGSLRRSGPNSPLRRGF